MSVERPDFIHKQPQQGRVEGKKSLQGPTTVDPFEEARIAHEKTMKDFRKGMIPAFLIGISVGAPVLLGVIASLPDKKAVSEPSHIELKEQGRDSHPSPVPGVPFP